MFSKTLKKHLFINCNELFSNNSHLRCIPSIIASQQTTVSNIEQLKSYDEIPGPRSYPLIGCAPSLKGFGGDLDVTNIKELSLKLQKVYGDIVKFDIPGFKQIFVFKPEYAKKVFAIDGDMPIRIATEPIRKYFDVKGYPQTLVNSQGLEWRKLRTASNPIISRIQSVQLFMKQHDSIANDFINYLNTKFENGSNVIEFKNLELKLKLLAMELISVVAFDNRLYCVDENNKNVLDTSHLIKEINNFFTGFANLVLDIPIWKFFPTPTWKKFEKACDVIYGMSREYVNDAIEKIKELSDEERANLNSRTILQQYLLTKDKYGLTNDNIIALTSDFVFGGIDTTATTLHFALYELSRNQEVQDDLQEEIDRVVGKSEHVTEDMLAKMHMLKAVLKETFRMHSVAPGNARTLKEDLILDNYKIPKGVSIIMAYIYITRSDRFFKDPDSFRPKRWIKSDKESDLIDPYSSLPFGFGARQCAGRRIAEQELYLTLIKLFQNYKFEYTGEILNPRVRGILQPDKPLHVKLTRRN